MKCGDLETLRLSAFIDCTIGALAFRFHRFALRLGFLATLTSFRLASLLRFALRLGLLTPLFGTLTSVRLASFFALALGFLAPLFGFALRLGFLSALFSTGFRLP